jgi:hypothetical protein
MERNDTMADVDGGEGLVDKKTTKIGLFLIQNTCLCRRTQIRLFKGVKTIIDESTLYLSPKQTVYPQNSGIYPQGVFNNTSTIRTYVLFDSRHI